MAEAAAGHVLLRQRLVKKLSDKKLLNDYEKYKILVVKAIITMASKAKGQYFTFTMRLLLKYAGIETRSAYMRFVIHGILMELVDQGFLEIYDIKKKHTRYLALKEKAYQLVNKIDFECPIGPCFSNGSVCGYYGTEECFLIKKSKEKKVIL